MAVSSRMSLMFKVVEISHMDPLKFERSYRLQSTLCKTDAFVAQKNCPSYRVVRLIEGFNTINPIKNVRSGHTESARLIDVSVLWRCPS